MVSFFYNKTKLLIGIICLVLVLIIVPKSTIGNSHLAKVSGWAWSDNIGWISFSNDTDGSATSYGVDINNTTGDFSGFAFYDTNDPNTMSDERGGWIKFNPSGPYPEVPNYSAKLDWGTGVVTGWARACIGYANPNACSGVTNTNGWDGWIKFSGLSGSGDPYGVVVNTITNKFSGFAWGSSVIGWIKFDPSAGSFVSIGDPTAPVVTSIDPVTGVNSGPGPVPITSVEGLRFAAGAEVRLTKSGETDIVCLPPFTFENSTELSNGTCLITNAAIGQWNVVVKNLDGKEGILPNGFTIFSPVNNPPIAIINSPVSSPVTVLLDNSSPVRQNNGDVSFSGTATDDNTLLNNITFNWRSAGCSALESSNSIFAKSYNVPGVYTMCLMAQDDGAPPLWSTTNPSRTIEVRVSQCSDGISNDADGLVDLNDPGCANDPFGDNEGASPFECSDNIDNDNPPDGLIDYDGDGDPGLIDPGCTGPTDDDETDLPITCVGGAPDSICQANETIISCPSDCFRIGEF